VTCPPGSSEHNENGGLTIHEHTEGAKKLMDDDNGQSFIISEAGWQAQSLHCTIKGSSGTAKTREELRNKYPIFFIWIA